MSATKIPELPAIDDINLLFAVLTLDKSPAGEPREWYDSERLAELGGQVLSNIVTIHYFSKRPPILAEEIKTWRQHQTSPTTINGWLETYELKDKLRVPLDMRDTVHNDAQKMTAFFHSYVAAVYLTKGLPVVQAWISKLMEPDANVEQPSTQTPTNNHASASSTSNSSASTSLIVPISLVNQVAMQRNASINYVASQEGPSHSPSWTIRCLINGVEKGMGVGKTQKVAKEDAARQAWVAMGW